MIAASNNYNAAPDELKQLARWVCWKFETKPGDDKPSKLPCNAYSATINAHDQALHMTFTTARDAAAVNAKLAGIGFVLTDADDLLGLDFDWCLDAETGEPLPWAKGLLERLAALTYCERSPSGQGVKFFARGKLPNGCPKRLAYLDGEPLPGKSHIEQYEDGRFFTVTGQQWGTVDRIGDVQEIIDELQKRCRKPETVRRTAPAAVVTTSPVDRDRVIRRASAYLAKMPPSVSGSGGHDAAYAAAQAMVNGFALDAADAEQLLLAEFNPQCSPPWSDADLIRKVSEAIKNPGDKPRGWLLNAERPQYSRSDFGAYDVDSREDSAHPISQRPFSNAKGEKPLAINEIHESLAKLTDGWPRRMGSALFVPVGTAAADWLTSSPALFAWIGSQTKRPPRWKKGGSFVGKEECFAGLCRTAPAYDAVEFIPHVPPMARHYYAWQQTAGGDGAALQRLLDYFSPATDVDRDLILALFASLVWGGPGGARPAFVLTSDAGRGAGKSSLAKIAGLTAGGMMDFSQAEAGEAIKSRLLSPDGISCRVALLDNVKSRRFSWAEFEALITAPAISGKRMYVGEARRPNTLVWLLTLNGACLSTDVAQRCVIIKLAAPQRSAGWEEEVTRYATENREAILGDLVGFHHAPANPPQRFTRWASWEAAVLSRLSNPTEAQRIIIERQGEADAERDELEAVEDYFAERLTKLGYDPESEMVHVPAQIAARWWVEATGDRQTITAVSRTIKQLHDEGNLRRIQPNPSRTHGRGFVWLTTTSGYASIAYDLERRQSEYSGNF